MKTYDYSKLNGKMRESGITQANLAKMIGISETSMNLRLKNKANFKQNEMLDICNVLHIPVEQVDVYFFAT